MKIKIAPLLMLSSGLAIGCARDQNPASRTDATAQNTTITPDAPITENTRFAAGQIAESENDPARAAQQYEEAVKLNPKAVPSLLRLGIIYTTNQRWDQAVDAWNRYIKATNNSAAGYSNLGYCLELANRLPAAETAFKTGIARDPRNESCRVNYGLMLARQGRLNEATTEMSAVLPTSQVHYNIASVLQSQGKKDAAKGEFQQAVTADPNMNDARERLAALEKD